MSRDIATRSKKLAKKVDKKLQSRTKSIANRENREQYEFNVGILEHLEELETMRDMEGVGRRVTNKIADMKEDIEYRNKLILIADSSESTWDTVQEYKKRDLADDSDDEKKLRMAENRAKRMRLARPGQGASRFRPRAPSATIVGPQQIFTNNTSQPIAVPLVPNVQPSLFRIFGSVRKKRNTTMIHKQAYPINSTMKSYTNNIYILYNHMSFPQHNFTSLLNNVHSHIL